MFKISPFNLQSLNILPSFKGTTETAKQPAADTSALERSPQTDVVKITKKETNHQKELFEKYQKVVQENILGEEINNLLAPQKNANGTNSFTKEQARIINLALKKIDFYKEIAGKLEKDGNDSIDEIINQTKKIFGGEKGLGKYLKPRMKNGQPISKDAVSIYNKIIKEFKDKYIKGQILDSISIHSYNKNYKDLDKDEKELIKLYSQDKDTDITENIKLSDIEQVLKCRNKEGKEAVDWIRDLVGLRLVLPDDIDMSKVEHYLTDAILKGNLEITKISNYHSSHIYPYISQNTLKMWKQMSPGIIVANSSNVRKKNGYTTTQMNINYKVTDKNGKEKTIQGELQIRSESLNKLGQIEHLIYDILENKNIGKDIKELEEFYNSTGIVDAVNEVFNDPIKENNYLEYEKTTYAAIRENEKKDKKNRQDVDYPLLADFGLGAYDVLSFDSLEYIDKKANKIKQKYGNKN